MLLLIDNYDSFTYNLYHYFGKLGVDVKVYRNDKITVEDAVNMKPKYIVISPGPKEPSQAGISVDLIKAVSNKIPLLGVCLGHQAIAYALGGKIIRAPELVHGKTSSINHTQTGLFEGLPNPFIATRYHSLMVDTTQLPPCLKVIAETDSGIIMGLAHKDLPIYGVQFHPESIASECGYDLLNNFILNR